MNDKCSKYEGLFIFSDKEKLEQHIAECECCQKEHEKMKKVSELLGEVQFYYKSKARKSRRFKSVCAALLMVMVSTLGCFVYNDADLQDEFMYGQSLSASELGLPVDSYGLIMVDE